MEHNNNFVRYAAWHKRVSIERFMKPLNAYRLTMEGDCKQRSSFIEYDWRSKEIISYHKVLPHYTDMLPADILGQKGEDHNMLYVIQAEKITFANQNDPNFGYEYAPPVYLIYLDESEVVNPANTNPNKPFIPIDTTDIETLWVRRLHPNSPKVVHFTVKEWADHLVQQRHKWQKAYLNGNNKQRCVNWRLWLLNERGTYLST